MPRLRDPARIRAILETDRNWAVYALGDLAPEHAPHCEWRAAAPVPGVTSAHGGRREQGAGAGLILVYHAFDLPVLFCLGAPEAVRPLLAEVPEPRLYLLIRPEILPLIEALGAVGQRQAMWRMILDIPAFQPSPADGAQRLGPADFPALEALYADGAATGEAPDFFSRAQMEHGLFYGLWEAGGLIAAAGTHLFSAELNVGAVGNVYVRRDRRGRGLGGAVTRAVTAALLARGVTTLALNVDQTNAPALRVYERLGFRRYCAFWEGVLERRA
jgi:GNAT superfamily N-acetyltransferase